MKKKLLCFLYGNYTKQILRKKEKKYFKSIKLRVNPERDPS